MKKIVYGYCRISTMKQRLQRQIDNIKERYPDAVIISETFTGTTTERPKWTNLVEQIKKQAAKGAEVTLVFDEVSRMSRNAEEGFSLYRELYDMGINLVFLKEPHINTDTYRNALQNGIATIGNEIADIYIKATNEALMVLAERQIKIAFETAQAEIEYLHRRTAEGVRKAQAAGKQVGRKAGTKAGDGFKETQKAIRSKEFIKKRCRDFGGDLSDSECIKLTELARNTYYRYKKQIKESMGE